MRVYLMVFLGVLALSGVAPASASDDDDVFGPFYNGYTTTCQHGSKERLVRVAYLADAQHVPCEVRYAKPIERPEAGWLVLWHAHHTEGYCERKAELLISRLTGWGWQCGEPVWSEEGGEDEDHGHEHSRTPDNPAVSDCDRFGGYYCD